MGYDYDKLYGETPDALGTPSRVFVDFFAGVVRSDLRVLDIGCGQGRDALFIARLGHRVVGVDLSANGIRDLNAVAAKDGLPIEGICADITEFAPLGAFDVLLIDRTLHMLSERPRLAVLGRLIDHVAAGGWALIEDEKSNMAGFKSVMEAHSAAWRYAVDKGGSLFAQRA